MISFFLFVLSTIGLTGLVVDSKIFSPVRTFLKSKLPASIYQVFECYQCSGTWFGFFCGYWFLSSNVVTILLCGAAGSFLAGFYFIISEYLLSKIHMPTLS